MIPECFLEAEYMFIYVKYIIKICQSLTTHVRNVVNKVFIYKIKFGLPTLGTLWKNIMKSQKISTFGQEVELEVCR